MRRVAIVGAGDYGERLGREVRNTSGSDIAVVCYVDDDKDKIGLSIQGVPIVGPIENLEDVCAEFEVDAVLVGIASLSEPKLKDIIHLARRAGVALETRERVYSKKTQPVTLLFDRLARSLGRTLPARRADAAAEFFAGKRVLVTNGGDDIGPPLVAELCECGAQVTVQLASPSEARRFGRSRDGGPVFVIGNLEREIDAARLLDTARPQAILHCVGLDASPAANERDFLWRRVVRTSDAFCKILPKYGVESVACVFMWGGEAVNSFAGRLAAVSETLILNTSELLPSAPKVIRLPAVLTGERLLQIVKHADVDWSRDESGFAILEGEAVTLCLEAVASSKGRALIVPRDARPITAGKVAASLTIDDRGTAIAPIHEGSVPQGGPLFPIETTRASVLRGAMEVISPVCPADDVLLQTVSECLVFSQSKTLDDRLKLLDNILFERAQTTID